MSQAKASNQGTKIWPDIEPPKGFMSGYSNAPAPGKVRGSLGRAAEGAVQHALKQGSKRITQINEGTRAGVRKRIQEAIAQGMTPQEAGAYVREWTGFDEYRAERIARTEMMFSYNDAALGTYQEVGITQVVADDGDEDDECAERHGQVFSLDEAEGIVDHPNGTLDWLPVDPGTSAESIQRELSAQRDVAQLEEKVARGGGGAIPTIEPPVLASTFPLSEMAEKAVSRYMETESNWAQQEFARNGRWGNKQAAIFDNPSGDLEVVIGRGNPAGFNSQQVVAGRHMESGQTLVVLNPSSDARALLSMEDVQASLQSGANIRVVSPSGNWVQITPRGIQEVPDNLLGEVRELMRPRLEAGVNFEQAWDEALTKVVGKLGDITSGDFTVLKPVPRPVPVSNPSAPWVSATRDQVGDGIRSGKWKLEDVAKDRWGWKGGTPGTADEGKFVLRPGARAKTGWTKEHEARFAEAYEDAAAKAGGHGKFEVDMVDFSSKPSARASADYGKALYHSEANRGGLVKTSRIRFYRNTVQELGGSSRSEYQDMYAATRAAGRQVDDFYSTAQHELGHAFDYGSVTSQREFDALWQSAKSLGSDTVGRLDSQLRTAVQEIGWKRRALKQYQDELLELRGRTPTPEMLARHQSSLDYQVRLVTRYTDETAAMEKHVAELTRMRDEALAELRRLGRDGDRLMTKYSGQSGREGFAESMLFYLNAPELLKQRAPGVYRFIEEAIAHSKRYRP